jgi:hypothetical protein
MQRQNVNKIMYRSLFGNEKLVRDYAKAYELNLEAIYKSFFYLISQEKLHFTLQKKIVKSSKVSESPENT